MKIQFGSLKEIKEFILMVDIYQLCDKQPEWGGKGYIINDRYVDPDEKREIVVANPEESKVIHGYDQIIVTPYYKQLSWLFETLYHFVEYGNELSAGIFLDHFHVGCEGYFIMNPSNSAKELMVFILDGLKRVVDANRETSIEK